jgi:hypothetical protein
LVAPCFLTSAYPYIIILLNLILGKIVSI